MDIFQNAKRIFIKNKRSEVNFQAGFKCKFSAKAGKKYVLQITGATLYEVYLNNEFIFYGPARAPHGYVRADEILLNTVEGENVLCVSVAGYNCKSFYTMGMKSFLMAEIFEDGKTVAYTGKDFTAISLDGLRKQKVYRYSYQRAFTEVWSYDNSSDLTNWKTQDFEGEPLIDFAGEEKIIPREFPNPLFNTDTSARAVRHGRFKPKDDFSSYDARHISRLGADESVGFMPDTIEDHTMAAVHGCYFIDQNTAMHENRYTYYEFAHINSGFIRTEILAMEDSEVYIIFSEKLLEGGKIDCGGHDNTSVNIIKYTLKKSNTPYDMQSFECYSFKYLGVLVLKGEVLVKNIGIREYSYPYYENIVFKCSDKSLEKIFEAAKETFRQNTVDCFMDCPGRERAGWLCDSYFTAKASRYLSGDTKAEEIFLKNFVMAKEFPGIPDGMLPEIYPGENLGCIFQWAMWYVLQVNDYLKRSGDNREYFKKTIYDFLTFCKKYETSDGMIGAFNGWNFIEWSDANEYVTEYDISYPTNMMYSEVLRSVGKLYGDTSLTEQAEKISRLTVLQSFDGEFFADGAVYDENKELKHCGDISEACQFYAAFFGVAERQNPQFNKFFDLFLNTYGLGRRFKGIMPEVAYANLFIGYTVRLNALLKLGEYDRLLKETVELYGPMAEKSGTLWEHYNDIASLNHGISSVAAVFIVDSLIGIIDIDDINKTVTLTKDTYKILEFEISMGIGSGKLVVCGNEKERKIIENSSGYELIYK